MRTKPAVRNARTKVVLTKLSAAAFSESFREGEGDNQTLVSRLQNLVGDKSDGLGNSDALI